MTTKKKSPGLFRETPAPKTPFEKTAAAAREIIDSEKRSRDDRTAALKAARLEREAKDEEGPSPGKPPKSGR
ncbi:hypothetical protein [Mangrovicoccus sp. HB161399]|uniref:hypothetical protein n=1 Tax=Mangrovicoccus sp. HB161399 TaxID=2720392 RepID=UPI001552FC16|nr:hypothetical protein [Mangrovicoccus sp. HB161399]